jgi:hypothetical protein
MGGITRSAAVLVALMASIPITVFITLIIRDIFVRLNNGAALHPEQLFLTLFAAFSFGLASFFFLLASNMRREE